MTLREHDILDVTCFRKLTKGAHQASLDANYPAAAELLERAIAIWRTPPLADLPATAVIQPFAVELLETRYVAEESLVDARIKSGEHREVLPMLKALTAAKPSRERRWEQLMLALYRSGRQAEALDAYARARSSLREEFGIEPGSGLKRLQEQVLANDPALDIGADIVTPRPAGPDLAPSVESPTPITAPCQLPNTVQGFVGRHLELARLAELAHSVGTSQYSTVVVVISGTVGVGKSALAIYFAHQIANDFPDGQLYVDLKGFAQGGPDRPEEALGRMLDALGIPPERIPATLDARAALYRSLLAHRRTLVVVDDAFDSTQVRPLVPANPGCMMIVTSRRKITSLITSEGAHLINLDVPSADEAETLLVSRLNQYGVGDDTKVVAELAERCGFLPLALAVIAARAAERPDLPLDHLAAEMQESWNLRDIFSGYEPDADVRVSFFRSYESLTPATARMFRLLSLHPGPEITVGEAASLAGVHVADARSALGELSQLHLVAERFPGRFHLDDLSRAYVGDRLEAEQQGCPAEARMAPGILCESMGVVPAS
jgi:tetratricopeptide (TPR) repeat protein